MNNLETMEFEVVGFLRDHGGDYFLPADERIATTGTKVQKD